jgi:transposase
MIVGGNKEVAGIPKLVTGSSSSLFYFYCVFIKKVRYMALSRQERERLVLDLYNQGKNTRQIAEEARMSFSAIGAILKKATEENETSKEQTEKMSQAAKAYKLFSDGKSPVDVAIELNLRQAEVTEFYREYWNLKQLDDLNQVYEEIKGDIHSFVNLYKLIKSTGISSPQVIRLLSIANNDLPSVEYRYERLKRQEASLQAGNQDSARTLKELFDLILTKRVIMI